MNPKIIITCAVTGAGDTVGKSPNVPVTPEQIANSALEAAAAGAAVVHCHVREPKTGKGSRRVDLYKDVMERIRAKNKEVIINLTAGMGGDLDVGPGETPMKWGAGTDLVGPVERLLHVAELRPELCTLDCGSLNFGDGNTMVVQTPAQLREQARRFLKDQSSTKAVRAILEGGDTYDRALWKGMADMGWLGAAVPEAYGGADLGHEGLCVLAEEIGRALAPVPFGSSVYLATMHDDGESIVFDQPIAVASGIRNTSAMAFDPATGLSSPVAPVGGL